MERLRPYLAWGVYLLALFFALAFATYDPYPASLGHGGAGNLGGPAGELLARMLVEGLGAGSFALSFFLLLLGYRIQKKRPFDHPGSRVFGLFVLMFFLALACQLLLPDRILPAGDTPIGGLIGDRVAARLPFLLGSPASFGVAAAGLLCGFLLTTARHPRTLVAGAQAQRTRHRLRRLRARELMARSAAEEERPACPPAPPSHGETAPWPEEKQPEGKELDDEELLEEEELLEDEEFPEEALEEEEPQALPRDATPTIRQAVHTKTVGIQVIRLQRDPRLLGREKYELPPVTLLARPVNTANRESSAAIQRKAATLEEALEDFGVAAQVHEVERGPVITRFDLTLARGTKISKVTGLADDLAMSLGVPRVRIAPVQGKSALGVEIPNKNRETVFLRELALAVDMRKRNVGIPLFLGKDAAGNPILEDLAQSPHLLIAGRTGAGKSVFVNSLVLSILLTRYPEQVRLIMIDPKKVELEVYQDIPHLLTRVESNPKKAAKILEWAVNQMEQRYELLAATGVRQISIFNALGKSAREEKLSRYYSSEEIGRIPLPMPHVVIIVDELADLMMVSGKEVEQAIARLAQKARAVGIHVVLATQRPSTDVITGLIKSNLPARIAFQTRTGIDSRTILDRYGAEKLLDKGDMLYLSATSDDPRRIQGPFVSDAEVEAVVAYLKEKAAPQYTHHLEQVSSQKESPFKGSQIDDLFEQAVEVVLSSGQASASFLQRRMQVGYARASRLMDLMGDAGIVSEQRGSKAREILISREEWETLRGQTAAGASK